MLASGISNNMTGPITCPPSQNTFLIQQEFELLGSDLQSGNLPGAEQATAELGALLPQYPYLTSQISHDLKAGDKTRAEQDFSVLQVYVEFPGAAFVSPSETTPLANPLKQPVFTGTYFNNIGGFITGAKPMLQSNPQQNYVTTASPATLNRFSALA